MSVRRLSKSYISGGGDAGPKSSSFLASYSPAIDEMDLIERVSLSASAASIEFTGIPQTYQHLQIRGLLKESGTGTGGPNVVMQCNTDTTHTNYRSHYLNGNGSSATAGNVQASTYYCLVGNIATSNASYASMFGALLVDILDYASTSKNKVTRGIGAHDRNGSGEVTINSGLWMSTAAISSIKFTTPGSSFAQNSTLALYGIIG